MGLFCLRRFEESVNPTTANIESPIHKSGHAMRAKEFLVTLIRYWRVRACIVTLVYCALWLLNPLVSIAQAWLPIHSHFSNGDSTLTYWDAVFVSKDVGWYCGNASPPFMAKTVDGGETYEVQKQFQGVLLQLYAYDSLHVWARYTSGHNDRIVFTSDGGKTWDSTFITSNPVAFGPFHFFNRLEGFLFGNNLLYTTDGGITWTSLNYPDSLFIESVWDADFVNRQTAFVCGRGPYWTDGGFIGGTSDSGRSWYFKNSPSEIEEMNAIDFPDSLHEYSVGKGAFSADGVVYSTKDGGATWSHQYFVGSGMLFDVGFLDSVQGWISGVSGRIWHTTDGGASWSFEQTPVSVNLRKISVLRDNNLVYVIGDSSTLLRADVTTSVEVRSSNIPSSVILYQSYPDPFNNSTQISYTLAKTSNVTLKVYDILGRELATLVQGRQAPGEHSVTWNADVSSGVYFYRLVAGEFVETKKMVLMR